MVANLAVDEARASALALDALDTCQGTPIQTAIELVYYRSGALEPTWEVTFSDGQIVYVNAATGTTPH